MIASPKLHVVRVVVVVNTVTRNTHVVAGLLKQFMLLNEDVGHLKLLSLMLMLKSATWRRNRYILIVWTVNLESYASNTWVSARKLLLLPVSYARSSSVMIHVVWRKFAVKNPMFK